MNKNSLFRKWNTDSGSGAGAGGDDDCSCPSMMGGFFSYLEGSWSHSSPCFQDM